MDTLWKGLFGGVGSLIKTQSPRRDTDPKNRLERVKQLHDSVAQAVSRASALRTPGPILGQLYRDLFAISELLAEELTAPPPHLCLNFAADRRIYNAIGRAATVCRHEGVVYQAVLIFGSLLDSGSDAFAESQAFARTLMRFAMLILDARTKFVGEETEAKLIEVLFELATKIRHDTATYLPVWFSAVTRAHGQEHDSPNKAFIGTRQDDNFPLCYLFMDRMHKEGRIGDFARTGLLYLFECAARSEELDKWMVTSDIPTLMATALGALYSPLSRELSIRLENHNVPLILAMSDYDADRAVDFSRNIQNVNSPEHIANVDSFMSALVFWQDVLQHCKSSDIRRTLLDHFQILFLQQLLYPSILESSDSDGGSSVAVLTYIANMLMVLDECDLVDMILDYLFAVSRGTHSAMSSVSASPSVEERRRFLIRSTQSGNMEDSLDPSTFNLADMVRNALSSSNPQTLFAALNLHSVVVSRRPKYVIDTLLYTIPPIDHLPGVALDVIDASAEALLQDAMRLGDHTTLNKLYTTTCLDVRSQLLLRSQWDAKARRGRLLDEDDVSLATLFSTLETFLTNDVDVNLALTQAFVGITMSRDIRLEGLLLPSTHIIAKATTDVEDGLSDLTGYMDEEESAALHLLESQAGPTTPKPRLVRIIHVLIHNFQSLRPTVPKLDYILAKRSAILLTAEQRPSSSAGLSEFGDVDDTPRGHRSGSSRPVSRSDTRPPSVQQTPGRSATREKPSTRSDSTPRGRKFSPQHARAFRDRDGSGSPTPRAKATRSGSFMSPSRLTSALFGSSNATQQDHGSPRRASSTVFLQPPPVFELDDHEGEMLKRIVTFPLPASNQESGHGDAVGATTAGDRGGQSERGEPERDGRSASLSHVLTNAVLLRSFILELAAIVQLRAIIYDEARTHP